MVKNGSYCLGKNNRRTFCKWVLFLSKKNKKVIQIPEQDLDTGTRKINTYEVTKVYPWVDRFSVRYGRRKSGSRVRTYI